MSENRPPTNLRKRRAYAMRIPRGDEGSEDEKPEIDRAKRFASEVKMLRLARSLALSDLRKSQAAELVSLQKRHERAIAEVKEMYNQAIGSPLLSLKALHEAEETTVCPGCLQNHAKTELVSCRGCDELHCQDCLSYGCEDCIRNGVEAYCKDCESEGKIDLEKTPCGEYACEHCVDYHHKRCRCQK
mmetsp:Transcript_32264/g.63030  ORF Transcript_32264/g.63030 Transcript_32264/m.63030 type:complete len:187 (+) Transcript_32264:1-561(+)